jgi:cysteinyl-tRNA synthetase
MSIRIYDTACRQVRGFVPLEARKASIYLCGLTVQAEPHVGHVRSGVIFDVLRRWLTARGFQVTLIRNITDIADRILAKSVEQGRPWYNLAYAMRIELDKAYQALNVAPPTYEPAATGHVPEMIDMISRLIGRGHAYVAEDGSGDVYFAVGSWSAYGDAVL